MEVAKEIVTATSSLRQYSVKYSINFVPLQRFCKKLEEGSAGMCYISKVFNINFRSQNQQNV